MSRDNYEVSGPGVGSWGDARLFVQSPLLPHCLYSTEELLFTKHLLFPSSYELSSSSLKPSPYLLVLHSGWHISLNCLTVFEPLVSM